MSRSTEPRFAFAVLLYSRRRGGTTDYWSWPPCGSSGGRAISRWWCVLMSAKVILGASAVVVSGSRQRWSSAQDGSATLGADLGGCAVLISV